MSSAVKRRKAMQAAARTMPRRQQSLGLVKPRNRDGAARSPGPLVFISYAHGDRSVVESLHAYLEELGLPTWWDDQLLAGQTFHEQIVATLNSAQAVIVIWSKESVASHFVLDEASLARNAGKLITTHVPDFDPEELPIGFRQFQSILVEDRPRLVRSLAGLGLSAADDAA